VLHFRTLYINSISLILKKHQGLALGEINMAYNATYAASDAPTATIDLVVTILAYAATFGGLIALVILYQWFRKKSPRF